MIVPCGRKRPAPGLSARYSWSLRHLVTSAVCVWLLRAWNAEWLLLVGLMLAEGLSRLLPLVAAVVRHG